MMKYSLILLILFVFVGCNSKEAQLASIQGIRDPNNPVPYIVSIMTPSAAIYTAGSYLDFYVTYSETVIVDGHPSLIINADSGQYQAVYLDGDGTNVLHFRSTVILGMYDYDGIQLSGVVKLNGGSIYDPDDDDDSLLTYTSPSLAGVLLDGITPSIFQFTVLSQNYVTNQDIIINAQFTYDVCVTGTPRLRLNIGGYSAYAKAVNGTCGKLIPFTYKVLAADLDADGIDLTGTIVDLTIAGSSINDRFGEVAMLAYGSQNFSGLTVNSAPPTIVSKNVPAAGSYKQGSNLDFSITFSETVYVASGTPHLTLNINGSLKNAVMVSGSGSSTLNFRYSVSATDLDTDGIAVTGFSYNGAAIRDNDLNPAPINNTWPTMTSVIVDGVAPTITSVSGASGNYKISDTLEFLVQFSENVYVSGYPALKLDVGGISKEATYLNGSGTNTLSFRYSVASGDLDTNGVSIESPLLLNGGFIRDAAGNNSVITHGNATFSSSKIDGVRPTLTISIPAVAPTVIWRPGNTMAFSFTTSESVNIAGSPTLQIRVGDSNKTLPISYSGNPTSSFSFSYTTTATDMDLDGVSFPAATVSLSGGATIRDQFGNDAVITFIHDPMTNLWVLPNEIKYWFDASDTLTTTAVASASSFKSKATALSPSPAGGTAPVLNDGPNGTKYAKFNGTNNYFVMTATDTDIVIAAVKTPTATGNLIAVQSTESHKIGFDLTASPTMYGGTYCILFCDYYRLGSWWTMGATSQWTSYSFSPNQYRTIAVDFKSPGAAITYRIGQFNGEIGEMFILSSGSNIDFNLVEKIGTYLNNRHGSSW